MGEGKKTSRVFAKTSRVFPKTSRVFAQTSRVFERGIGDGGWGREKILHGNQLYLVRRRNISENEQTEMPLEQTDSK